MSALSNFAADDPVLAFSLGATLLGLALWLGWRWPTVVLALALASLAVRPQLLWGGPEIGYEWGLHQTLLVVALMANALHFGGRKTVNWPIVALLVVFGLNLLFGDLHPHVTLGVMLTSLALLALPFAFTDVKLAPDSRHVCALVIALTPLLSVAIGALLQLAGIHTTFASFHDRLEGATGNAAVFATLAFAGFAVALHESASRGRPWIVALAGVNLALVILSGTRMAMLASAVLLFAYVLASKRLRERLWRSRALILFGICLVGPALALYMPTIYRRMFEGLGRSDVWQFFYGEFWLSPIFGRGIGSGFVASVDWPEYLEKPHLPTPHNEYLHLLVIGGVSGLLFCIAGITLWYSRLMRAASPHDREFLIALAPAIAVYAITDNILFYSSALALYAYLGVVHQPTAVSFSIPIEHAACERGADLTTRLDLSCTVSLQGRRWPLRRLFNAWIASR